MFERLDEMEIRLETLDRQLADPAVVSNAAKLRDLGREHAAVSEVVDAWRHHKHLLAQQADARLMLDDDDAEIRAMAKEELSSLDTALAQSSDELKILLLPRDPWDGRPLIMEIRAGTGGDEAALFAGDLFRMYAKFCEHHQLRFEVIDASPISVGGRGGDGFKEVTIGISGTDAWRRLRFEAGVHRVQRVPATETQGRIHTSAATVAVLPEPEEVEVHIDPKDLRIDVMRAGGPGGQSVNTTDSAVRIVHIPTGMIVICQDEKSQIKNKDRAMRVLKARLLALEQERSAAEGNAARRAMIGSGDRSERIRTYNFPQNRVTDHRINLTLYQLDQIIAGALEELTDTLTAHWRTQMLEDQDAVHGAP